MLKTCDPFARVTEHHDFLALKLTPCAGFLYRILLRAAPAGKPQEFELKEFCAWADYSLKWAKAALRELCDLELVEVLRTFSGQGYKLIAHHPDRQKTSPISPETSRSGHETSQKQPSNPYPIYPSYRESRETTDKPTHHPVNPDERESATDLPKIPTPPEPEIEPQILEQLQTAGFQLNSTLSAIVRSTQAQIVLQAIAAAQQYLTKLQQKNQPLRRQPEALLVSAIREKWQPQRGESGTNAMPPEFDEWFRLAKAIGLAKASSIQADVTGMAGGILCVLTDRGWTSFDEMLSLFRLSELKEMGSRSGLSAGW
ncbi:MAG: hypothetical protein HC771_16330 [Synechococcales cyanobacterium CRU_2_2]|nr:hypothetical protein [Synechococcales cyanobacterium CRU_2_2]